MILRNGILIDHLVFPPPDKLLSPLPLASPAWTLAWPLARQIPVVSATSSTAMFVICTQLQATGRDRLVSKPDSKLAKLAKLARLARLAAAHP